jgi:hypothetical protein
MGAIPNAGLHALYRRSEVQATTIEEIVTEASATNARQRETRARSAPTPWKTKTPGLLLRVGLLRFITAGSVDDGKSTRS